MAAEKLQVERETMQTPRKVRMRLGVSFFLRLLPWLGLTDVQATVAPVNAAAGSSKWKVRGCVQMWRPERLIAQGRSRIATRVVHATCASMLVLPALGLQVNGARASSVHTGTTSA